MRLAIIDDEKDEEKEVDIDELTEIGRRLIECEAKELIDKLQDIDQIEYES